jgi:hypothetical protein
MTDKLKLSKMLQRDGRWPDAREFKDSRIRELRSDGLSKADAGTKAWAEVEAKFPPLQAKEPEPPREAREGQTGEPATPSEPVPVEPVEYQFEDPPREMDHLEILQWIENALGSGKQARELTFPNHATKGWYDWAAGDRTKFVQTLLSETRRANEAEKEAAASADVELDMQVAEITEMIDEAEAAVDKEMADEGRLRPVYGKDRRTFVRKKVRNAMVGWSRRFGVAKTHRTKMEESVCRLFIEIEAAP